jgi:type IV secretion system protein VirB10
MRLSRKVLIGLGVMAGLGIGGALILALQGRSGRDAPSELYSTDRNPQADGLANLPRDYAGIPQLGPPLPGDLGRPILRAQERGQPVAPPPVTAAPGPDPAEQRRLQAPLSPFVIQAGAVIPAALVTGLRSDLPGQITAQVTENVFDSPTGRHLLIPQGARLIGTYDNRVSFGQSRVLLVWTDVLP